MQNFIWNDSVLRVEPPTFVFKEIIDTEPGLKGDTVSNTLKPAKIVSCKEIQVPIFINIGDTIKIENFFQKYQHFLLFLLI